MYACCRKEGGFKERKTSLRTENFDRIIFDGVPINGLPDSLVMANIVDRVIVASSLGYTKIDELGETKKALEKIDAKIAGVVVNRAQKTKRGKYSSYYSE